jgi:nucleotide sugar dehydrogenase
MKIGIIGLGYVGSAIAWAHRDQNVIVRDPKLKDSAELTEFLDCDGIFVCVPSPSSTDGHCDTRILESVLKELLFVLINNPIPIICKTTAPPSVYEQLQQQYPNVVYCPEFLTAANNIVDYQNAEYIVLGGEKNWCIEAREIIKHGVSKIDDLFIITDIKTASLYKYMMNCYLATKVTFMNDFANFAEHLGVDWGSIRAIAAMDVRIGHTHMEVPGPDGQKGWGGMCFPKDIAAIQMEALDLGTELELLGCVEDINKKHRSQ